MLHYDLAATFRGGVLMLHHPSTSRWNVPWRPTMPMKVTIWSPFSPQNIREVSLVKPMMAAEWLQPHRCLHKLIGTLLGSSVQRLVTLTCLWTSTHAVECNRHVSRRYCLRMRAPPPIEIDVNYFAFKWSHYGRFWAHTIVRVLPVARFWLPNGLLAKKVPLAWMMCLVLINKNNYRMR